MIKQIFRGFLAGFRATVPMTGLMELGFRLLPRKEQYPLPPREIAGRVIDRNGNQSALSERQRTLLTLLSHFAYGGTAGAVYSLVVGPHPSNRRRGAMFGLLVWLGSYLGWLPLFGVLKPATQHPLRRNILMVAAHLLWGASLGAILRAAQARDHRFAGKTVVVMGGSRGLGLELARRWAEEGAKVAICARTERDLVRAEQELLRYGGEVLTGACDIAQAHTVESFINMVIDRWGHVDVLVNNAGMIQAGPMDCMTEDDYRAAMETHFWGPRHAIDTALPAIRKPGGRIVNIVSIGGKISIPHLLPYSASKFTLAGYSEGITTELSKRGIYVTTVYPGLMRTGSPRNASFKGQHRKEYAWFSICDSLPLVSISSARAARQIVEACRHGDPVLEITPLCRAASRLHALFPTFFAEVLQWINDWLPRSGGVGRTSRLGVNSQSGWSPSVLTKLSDQAAQKNNELGPFGMQRSEGRKH